MAIKLKLARIKAYFVTMKTEIKIVSLAVAGILAGWANFALAVPVANQQGDYPMALARTRGNRQVNWVVVDSDSQGLNCRMAQRFQSISVDGLDAPAELFPRNKHNVSQWAVVTTFRRGQRLEAGYISIVQGRSISADNLFVRIRDLLPKCFAPTNIFAKMRCTLSLNRFEKILLL